jgi:dTDP-glucose 4,6-dehydratase
MKYNKILVTGGRGFIGSHFVEKCLANNHEVIDIDTMTYASSKSLPWDSHPNYKLLELDISSIKHIPPCDIVVNFAAESHVDNSIESPKIFFESNIKGVFNLLELIRGKVYDRPIFFHISTDEVYGDIRDYWFTENDKLNPGNPYSATKAAAEMLVLAYNKTYNLDYFITRSSNNYGPRQYCEKLIPKIIDNLKHNKKIPLQGDGSYVRDWIYVKDNIDAIYHIMNHGEINNIYNVSCNNHLTNIEVSKIVCGWFGIENYNDHIEYVPNRLGQDIRYSISNDKLLSLGWKPKFTNGLYKFL